MGIMADDLLLTDEEITEAWDIGRRSKDGTTVLFRIAKAQLFKVLKAGYKSPEEIKLGQHQDYLDYDRGVAVTKEFYKGYVKLAEDQHPPQCPYDSLIFPTTIEEAGKFLTEKGLTDREKSAVSGAIARLGWENCQKANDEEDWRRIEL
jgi:hypothetical protein